MIFALDDSGLMWDARITLSYACAQLASQAAGLAAFHVLKQLEILHYVSALWLQRPWVGI